MPSSLSPARFAHINADQIQTYLARLSKRLAPSTVRRGIFTTLRRVFAVAVERRYIGVNPCDGVRLSRIVRPQDDDDEHRYVTERQARDLADAMTPRYRLYVLTATYTGARAGELRALRRRDYNSLKRQLDIRRSLSEVTTTEVQEERERGAEVHGNLVFKSTKTYERRRVTLPAWLAAELDEHLATRPADPNALIFATAEGEPIRQSNFYRRHFKPAVRRRYCAEPDCGEELAQGAERRTRCGCEQVAYVLPPDLHGLRFHDLRHSHASWLIAKGVPAGHVMKRLGHKDIRTTFNTYGHLYLSDEAALAGLFDAEPQEPENIIELRAGD